MAFNLTFTHAASQYIKQSLEKKADSLGFRLSVKKTGCSGLSYVASYATEANPNDILLETQDGVKVWIDSTWQDLLNGVEVDYVEEDKSGLKQKRLVYRNPNESGRCGCGESFHIEK